VVILARDHLELFTPEQRAKEMAQDAAYADMRS
jgi:hypothetical protein